VTRWRINVSVLCFFNSHLQDFPEAAGRRYDLICNMPILIEEDGIRVQHKHKNPLRVYL
jgi:hypothetical protein